MEDFRIGDFIRFKNVKQHLIDRINDDINIFEISSIVDGNVELFKCKGMIPFSDIEPIPVNGKDDFQIYYCSTNVCATTVINPYTPIPLLKTDYSYYYDSYSFKINTYLNKNLPELIVEQGIKYVHEIQHYLLEEFNDNGLIIKNNF